MSIGKIYLEITMWKSPENAQTVMSRNIGLAIRVPLTLPLLCSSLQLLAPTVSWLTQITVNTFSPRLLIHNQDLPFEARSSLWAMLSVANLFLSQVPLKWQIQETCNAVFFSDIKFLCYAEFLCWMPIQGQCSIFTETGGGQLIAHCLF